MWVAAHQTGEHCQLPDARLSKLELQNFSAVIAHYTGSAVDTKQRHFPVLIHKAITHLQLEGSTVQTVSKHPSQATANRNTFRESHATEGAPKTIPSFQTVNQARETLFQSNRTEITEIRATSAPRIRSRFKTCKNIRIAGLHHVSKTQH